MGEYKHLKLCYQIIKEALLTFDGGPTDTHPMVEFSVLFPIQRGSGNSTLRYRGERRAQTLGLTMETWIMLYG